MPIKKLRSNNARLMNSSPTVDPPVNLPARTPSRRSALCNVSSDVNASLDSSVMIKMPVSLSVLASTFTQGCTKQCIIDVCQCKQGYIRDANKKCIPVEQCPKVTPEETCATKKCPPGTVCEQETIFCIRAPCPQPKPQCVKKEPALTCANVRCQAGTVCKMIDVVCKKAPCDPRPECVIDEPFNPCAATTCPVGSECRVKQVQCIRAPWGAKSYYRSAFCRVHRQDVSATRASTETPAAPVLLKPNATICTKPHRWGQQWRSDAWPSTRAKPSCKARNGANEYEWNLVIWYTTSRCSRECGPPKCQCRDNYFRHMNGSCVAKEHCSAIPMNCAANEYYTNCTSSCEPRCNGTKDICDKACGPPGCQCLPGYVRADDN
ncbi:trypsin Inhibitor like cysteine rich domain protein, partial [Ancylostoma ceylanicum]